MNCFGESVIRGGLCGALAIMLAACGEHGKPAAPVSAQVPAPPPATMASAPAAAPAAAQRVDSGDEANAAQGAPACIKPGGCIKWETQQLQSTFKRLDQESFSLTRIAGMSDLRKLLPPAHADDAIKLLGEAGCGQQAISVFQKPGDRRLVVLACNEGASEYPTLIAVNESSASIVRLNYGFMYQSGQISAITDVNHDGHPEFWVGGTTSECEEDCEGVETSGTAVVEATEDGMCVRAEPGDFSDVTSGYVDGAGKAALFSAPNGIASDGKTLYVADTYNNRIRKVEIATGMVTTLAGSSSTCPADGTGAAAAFNGPRGIVYTGGNLYVTDTLNNKIRRIEVSTGAVTTLAGSGAKGAADGIGLAATFNQPDGIASDGKNLYVVDAFSNKIRKIEIATGMVTTLAGSGRFDPNMAGAGSRDGCDDGIGTAASFCHPTAISIFDGNLYVSDQGNPRIRKVNIATGAVTTLAGSGRFGTADGPGPAATFGLVSGIANDGHYLYVADSINSLRRIDMTTGTVSSMGSMSIVGIFASGGDFYVTTMNNAIQKIGIANKKVMPLAGGGAVAVAPKMEPVARGQGESNTPR